MFAQSAGRPNAELGASQGFDAVPDRDDDVEIEMFDIASDAASRLVLNLCKFCTSCRTVQLTLPERISDVPGHDRAIAVEQFGHLRLR